MNDFSRIITLLRKEKGITQKLAAGDLGISQALLSHYEKGLRECGLDFLVRLCDYYNVSSDYILGRTPDRNGATLSVNDLEGAETNKDSHFTGSVMPAMNKRLISSSLNVIYDMLTKAGSKDLTNKVSEYFMICTYRIFRALYQSNKQNSPSMFNIPYGIYEGYSTAALVKSSAQLNAILADKSTAKQTAAAFELTT
ncbi:MAG: helix-turn-helix domain-containing protein, partial [Oscillospiraceae bacterium]